MILTFLVSLGCTLLESFGLVGPKECTDVVHSDDASELMMWFKLLIAPVVGFVFLGLLLLEVHFKNNGAEAADGNVEEEEEEIVGKSSKRRGKAMGKLSEKIRVTLVDQGGVGNRYKISRDTTMKQLLDFYCQRHAAEPDAILMRYRGMKLPLKRTVRDLKVTDMSVIDVETNYRKLHEDYRKRTETAMMQLQKEMEKCREARHDADVRIVRLERDLELQTKARSDAEAELTQLKRKYGVVEAAQAKLEMDVKTHQTHRRAAERSLAKLEKDMKQLKDRKKLERALSRCKTELEEKDKIVEELQTQVKQLQVQAQRNASTANASSDVKAGNGSPSSASVPEKEDSELRQQLQAIEQQRGAMRKEVDDLKRSLASSQEKAVTWMMKAETLESSNARLENANQLLRRQSEVQKRDANRLRELSRELAKLKTKNSAAEKELRKSQKQAKQLAAQNERVEQLQQELSELRAWKAQMAQYAAQASRSTTHGYSSGSSSLQTGPARTFGPLSQAAYAPTHASGLPGSSDTSPSLQPSFPLWGSAPFLEPSASTSQALPSLSVPPTTAPRPLVIIDDTRDKNTQ